ncbi:MAG TPA: M56 family metallopeptidase [Solirubrobacteraceae bacterium]|nr:M56 family metallopeptidase [Solirubrobacteraceae bacterium]
MMLTFLLLTIAGIGVARGCHVLARQVLVCRWLAQRTRQLAAPQPDRLVRVAGAAGLTGRVVLIGEPGQLSFVHGVLRPRVVLSQDLVGRLSDAELRAVLEHEGYHVANLDPLKIVVLRVLAAALFFLPALEPSIARYSARRELAADRRAISACGARSLAGALLRAVGSPDWSEADVAVPLVGQALLASRVSQLETGVEPPLPSFAIARATLASLGSIAVLTTGLIAAICADGVGASQHATVLAVAAGTLLDGIVYAAPFAGAGLLLLHSAGDPRETAARRPADRARGMTAWLISG